MITLLAFSITSGGIAAEDPTMVDAVFDEEADTIVTAPDTWVVAAFTWLDTLIAIKILTDVYD